VNLPRITRTVGLPLLIALASASPAHAGLLWYNGDYDGRTSLLNEAKVPATNTVSPPVQTSLVYDNFVVPTGQTWTITSVYSNDLVAFAAPPLTATWQILSGVSAGNGGTVVASGDTTATVTPLSGINVSGYTAETISASVPSLKLTAGTYWLAVAPDSQGYYGDQSFVMTTSGANSVGTPGGIDGNSYITNTYPTSGTGSYNFTPTTTALAKRGNAYPYGTNIDFSMGVNGAFVVPEPTSLVLVAVGLVGSLGWLSRRRSAPAL
jgi:hypothetical protein